MNYIKPADYRFDFAAEVAAATALYPRISDEFFFVDLKEQNSHVNPVYTCLGAAYEKFKNDAAALEKLKIYACHGLDISTSFSVKLDSGLRFILIYSRRMWQGASSELAFTLDHEMGHQLVPSGHSTNMAGRLMGESAADAFASLRSFQRFGHAAARKILVKKSTSRLTAPLRTHVKDDWEHLTGQVLTQILRDSENTDFASLAPDAMIEQAEYYATKFAPSLQHAQEQWALLNDIVDDEHIGNYGQDPKAAQK